MHSTIARAATRAGFLYQVQLASQTSLRGNSSTPTYKASVSLAMLPDPFSRPHKIKREKWYGSRD